MPARCSRGQPIFTPRPSEPTRPTPARDDHRHQDSRTNAACRRRSGRDLPAGHRPPAGHDALRCALLLPGPGGTTRRPHRRRVGHVGRGVASPLRADPATAGTRAVGCRDRAHRAWALEHPSEYLLLYGHTGLRITPGGDRSIHKAMSKVVAVLFTLMHDALAAGEIDTDKLQTATPAPLRQQLADWRETTEEMADLPDGALVACLIGYAQLHGAITLELVGRIPPQLQPTALFDLQMAHVSGSLTRRHLRGDPAGHLVVAAQVVGARRSPGCAASRPLHRLAGRLLAGVNIAPPALFVLGVGILAYGWWPRFRLDEPRIADLRSWATGWYNELARRLHRGARRR